jgi:hypothetical protein
LTPAEIAQAQRFAQDWVATQPASRLPNQPDAGDAE